MRKTIRRTAIVAGASAALLLIPAGVAFAAGNGHGPHRSGNPAATCTQDQLRLRDGTGVRHDDQAKTAGQSNGYQSGPMDGSGPSAVRPLDGTGNQWGR